MVYTWTPDFLQTHFVPLDWISILNSQETFSEKDTKAKMTLITVNQLQIDKKLEKAV